MEVLILGLVAGIGFASYALLRRGRPRRKPPSRSLPARTEERTPATIQVGDVVDHLGTDYLVEGVLTLSEEGRGARLYRMVDGASEMFLYAPAGGGDPLLLKAAPETELVGQPPKLLEHDGESYRLRTTAKASAIGIGALGRLLIKDRVNALEYTGVGGARILVLKWNGRADLFAGEPVSSGLLEIFPGK